ncbi:MAG: ComEC/Rec2 family competence protein [Treponema sp.]|nr:ComEC/Rec2 family competence protein [Treponema sp.]
MIRILLDYLRNPFIIASVTVAMLLYGGFVPLRPQSPYSSIIPIEEAVSITGRINSNPSRFSSGKYYSAQLKACNVSTEKNNSIIKAESSGKVRIWIPSSIVEAVYPGKLYSISGKTALIEMGEIVSCHGYWNSDYKCFVVTSLDYMGYDSSFWGTVEHFRAMCRLIFKRLMYSWSKAGGLILSLLSGSREYLGDGVSDSFRDAGLSHILALSGMHLSFFSGLSSKAGTSVFGKRWAGIFQALGILFFIWFAGLSPSLFRAFLCSLIAIIARGVFCCTADTLEILSLSFLIHVCVIPEDVKTAAFMLSYGALAGILIFSKLFLCFYSKIFPPKLSGSLSASTGAQVFGAPISISLFGSFAPVGIVATVFAAPLISLFFTLSIIAIILCLCMPFLSGVFGGILNMFYNFIVWIVEFFAKCPPVQV